MIPQIPQGPGTPFLCPELSGSGGGLEGSEVNGERGAQLGPQVGGQDFEFQPCPHYLKQDA